jgi:hypothetical protein
VLQRLLVVCEWAFSVIVPSCLKRVKCFIKPLLASSGLVAVQAQLLIKMKDEGSASAAAQVRTLLLL